LSLLLLLLLLLLLGWLMHLAPLLQLLGPHDHRAASAAF
jgi:hypothetical protein